MRSIPSLSHDHLFAISLPAQTNRGLLTTTIRKGWARPCDHSMSANIGCVRVRSIRSLYPCIRFDDMLLPPIGRTSIVGESCESYADCIARDQASTIPRSGLHLSVPMTSIRPAQAQVAERGSSYRAYGTQARPTAKQNLLGSTRQTCGGSAVSYEAEARGIYHQPGLGMTGCLGWPYPTVGGGSAEEATVMAFG